VNVLIVFLLEREKNEEIENFQEQNSNKVRSNSDNNGLHESGEERNMRFMFLHGQ